MTTLKDLTWDAHKAAERTPLMSALVNNTISDRLYSQLIYTKYAIFRAVEERVQFQHPELPRCRAAFDDLQEMGWHMPSVLNSLDKLVDRIRLVGDYDVWAHVYVHYLAPLYGGKIVKQSIQGRFPTRIYTFEDPEGCIAEVRKRCTVDLAREANLSFEMTTAYYTDLWNMENSSA